MVPVTKRLTSQHCAEVADRQLADPQDVLAVAHGVSEQAFEFAGAGTLDRHLLHLRLKLERIQPIAMAFGQS
jgi:hypothetical protein